jgi:galacturan 1,4-alpha-galacturonidase
VRSICFPADAVEVDHRTMLDNVVIHLNGNLVLPNNITKVQQEINVTTNQPSVASKFAFISGLLSPDVCIDIRYALVLLSWCGVCFLTGNGTDFSLKGNNVQLIGSTDFEWGRFYGFGNHWWDLGVRVSMIASYSF